MNYKLPFNDKKLLNIQKPAQYVGSEIGIPNIDFINKDVRFAISYPDTYELGMSNNGIKIIYDRINRLPFASAERFFAPWVDFEQFLRDNKTALFSLETKSKILDFDFVGFSIQYELLFTNILNMMDLIGIPLFAKERINNDKYPIVIAGGPVATSNPIPFSPFIDLFLIGEGEEKIEEVLTLYNKLKKEKTPKITILEELSKIESIYSPIYSKEPVKRNIFMGFSNDKGAETQIAPIIDTIQNKLTIEIARGCPNKCRFCQAAITYKPYREKEPEVVIKSIDEGLKKLGASEITFSSLSSGDYSYILELTDYFTKKYSEEKISFSLPSIKVETFDTSILEKLSATRKSGLTFAIESGDIEGQLSINKPVLLSKVKEIIEYATKNGYKLMKFYFMVGLPHIENEKESIIDFIESVLKMDRKLILNVNIATFVPKPHTPYQNEAQLNLEDSISILNNIKENYKRTRVNVKIHNPYMSYIEGLIARGDERVGLAIYDIFKDGAKFCSWGDKFDYSIYERNFEKHSIKYEDYLSKRELDSKFFWDIIDSRVDREFFIKENQKSIDKQQTDSCKSECNSECSLCGSDIKKIEAKSFTISNIETEKKAQIDKSKRYRYFLKFKKSGMLKFIGHIDIIKYFERLFSLTNLDVAFTEGFNPHPKMQFGSPLPLGIESECEVLELYTHTDYDTQTLKSIINKIGHCDLMITDVRKINFIEKISLMDNIHSIEYRVYFDNSGYTSINNNLESIENGTLNYEFEKKEKKIAKNIAAAIKITEKSDKYFEIIVKKESDMPRVVELIDFITDKAWINIVKTNQFTELKDNSTIDLFLIDKIL